jgi:hypothetical protein
MIDEVDSGPRGEWVGANEVSIPAYHPREVRANAIPRQIEVKLEAKVLNMLRGGAAVDLVEEGSVRSDFDNRKSDRDVMTHTVSGEDVSLVLVQRYEISRAEFIDPVHHVPQA